MPKRKDALIIAAVLLIAALMLLAARAMPKTDLSTKTADATLAPDAVEYLDATPEPDVTAAPETAEPASVAGPMPPAQTEKVRGYVLLTVGGRQYGDPIPMDRDKIITLRQEDGKINKVHITPEKVYMESSTCENQDCVHQGEIHIDTYQDRLLGTFVICLPNNVTIEMVPAE